MHSISCFRDLMDARACANHARQIVPEMSEHIHVDEPGEHRVSKWYVVYVDEIYGQAQQHAVRAIAVFAAKIEVMDPERAHCGMIHGKWMDPKVYLDKRG